MREIKFRAYCEYNKKIYNDCFSLQKHGYTEWVKFRAEAKDNIIWMQYTGLKDKNGVEIYEGDIVKSHYSNGIGLIEHNPFDNMSGFQIKHPQINIFDQKDIEVIGNIYENPELLK